MKRLVFVTLIIGFIHASPQTNQQAFQQGYNSINGFNEQLDKARAPLQDFINGIAKSEARARQIIAWANRLNPQTLEGCEQVMFATEFCFVNFAKELKEYKERRDCMIEAAYVARSLVDPWFSPGNGYEKKNCARFAPKPTKENVK